MTTPLLTACPTPDHPRRANSAGLNQLHGRPTAGRRWMATIVIVIYLSCVGHGVVCHMLQYRPNAHPLMYFTVWDMFCGWSGWSFRTHLIAEGESGQFYQLTPTPWGAFQPYSDLGREHYDAFHNHAWKIGTNCLRQTQHEPMVRMILVEETWSKKFNLPDPLWSQLHEEPREPHHYFHVNATYRPDGTLISRHSTFHDRHRTAWLAASLQGHRGPQQSQIRALTPVSN